MPTSCADRLNLPDGSSCISSSIFKKIEPLVLDLKPPKFTSFAEDTELPTDGSYQAQVIQRLAQHLGCKDEKCVLESKLVKSKLSKKELDEEMKRFKPAGPKDTKRGLCINTEIEPILDEWSKTFPFFYHVNKFFTKDSLMKLLDKKYPKIKCIAVNTNLKTEKQQNHGVTLFIDLRNNYNEWSIEYYDSTGHPPELMIVEQMKLIKEVLDVFKKSAPSKWPAEERAFFKDLKNISVDTIVPVHGSKAQMGETECGLYVLIYIRKRLEGISYNYFYNYTITDEALKMFRKTLFS